MVVDFNYYDELYSVANIEMDVQTMMFLSFFTEFDVNMQEKVKMT